MWMESRIQRWERFNMSQAKFLLLSLFSPPPTWPTSNIFILLLSNTKNHSWSHSVTYPISNIVSHNFTNEVVFNPKSVTNSMTLIQATLVPHVDDSNSLLSDLLALLQFIFLATDWYDIFTTSYPSLYPFPLLLGFSSPFYL